jgi:hypothetical protein
MATELCTQWPQGSSIPKVSQTVTGMERFKTELYEVMSTMLIFVIESGRRKSDMHFFNMVLKKEVFHSNP